MHTSDLQPWPHGDVGREAALRGLIAVGLAEAVRTDAGKYYRVLPPRARTLAPSLEGESDLTVRA